MTGAETLPGMDGRHPKMQEVYRLVRRAAAANLPVLIVGETGTGKELVARALHQLSNARDGEFVDINCAAIPDAMFEAELWGWERGSFTGAVGQGSGLMEVADGGTLFLDEVCSMPLNLQAKLLRAVEHKEFRRLGGRQSLKSDFRLVAAVSHPTDELIAAGRLREDLAFRLSAISVEIPPLRQRGADLVALANRFLAESGNGHHLCNCALKVMEKYPWPGNVRELRSLMQRLVATTDNDRLCAETIVGLFHRDTMPEDSHRESLVAALERNGWDIKAAAAAIGMSRTTLYKRMKEAGIERPDSVICVFN